MSQKKYRFRDRSADVVCPFFHSHSRSTIRCEGSEDGTVETTAYPRSVDLQQKMTDFCCCDSYKRCYRYATVMYAKYPEDEA